MQQQRKSSLENGCTCTGLLALHSAAPHSPWHCSKAAVQEVPLQRFAAPVRGAATMPLGLCRDQLAGRIYVLAGALCRGLGETSLCLCLRKTADSLTNRSEANRLNACPPVFPGGELPARLNPRLRVCATCCPCSLGLIAGDDALEVDASSEERDMWRVYLDKGDYRQALVHCRRWGVGGAALGCTG